MTRHINEKYLDVVTAIVVGIAIGVLLALGV